MVFQLINGVVDKFDTREAMLNELQQLIDDGLYEIESDLVAAAYVQDELEGTIEKKGPGF